MNRVNDSEEHDDKVRLIQRLDNLITKYTGNRGLEHRVSSAKTKYIVTISIHKSLLNAFSLGQVFQSLNEHGASLKHILDK